MTVSTNDPRKWYNGNGVTVAFAVSYFLANEDVKVYVDGLLKTLTTDYTLTGAGNEAGGTVTFVTAPPTGTLNVLVLVDPPLTQTLDLIDNGPNPAVPRERAFDKLTMIAQRLNDRFARSLILAETDADASLILPLKADRASTVLAFDADGDPIAAAGVTSVVVSAFMATVLDDADASAALTTLGVSTFIKTLLDDADADVFWATLMASITKSSARAALGVDSQTVVATLTPASNGDITLSSAENAANVRSLVNGAWTADHSIICDDVSREFIFINNSSYTATITTSGTTPTTVDVLPDGFPHRMIVRAGVGVDSSKEYIDAQQTLNDSLNGDAFVGTSAVTGVASTRAHSMLWNPVGSGKNLILNRIVATAQVAGDNLIVAEVTTTYGTKLADGYNKNFGSATAAVGDIYTGNTAAGSMPAGAQTRLQLYPSETAFAEEAYEMDPPIILPPGYGCLVSHTQDAKTIVVDFEWTEENV